MALNNFKETLNKKNILLLIISCCALLNAQQLSSDRAIIFPDIDNHFTLVSDFHSHTAFSDGDVWPTIRVEEAARDQLDDLAITDHLYKDPNKNFHSKDIYWYAKIKDHQYEINADGTETDIERYGKRNK